MSLFYTIYNVFIEKVLNRSILSDLYHIIKAISFHEVGSKLYIKYL